MKHILELQVFDGDKLIVRQSFDQAKIVIGRILSADFRVPDARVSRIHALLERLDDGSVRITDLASSHGTTVNGERVIERVVGPADDLRLAGLKLQMHYSVMEDAVSPQIPNTAPKFTPSDSPVSFEQNNISQAPVPSKDVPSVPLSAPRSMGQPTVKVNRDPTVIRSLKDSAKVRGVLEATGHSAEELEVTVYWGETILNIDHFRNRSKTIRIGESEGNDYIVASNVLPKHFDFIKVKNGLAEIQMHPSMRGSARVNGKIMHFEQGAESSIPSNVQITRDDIAKIQVGSVHFFFMFVGKPPAIRRDVLFDQGKLFWALQIFLSILGLAAMLFATQYQPPIEGQVKEFPERFRRVIVQTYKAQAKPAEVAEKVQTGQTTPNAQEVQKSAQVGGNSGAGAREKGEEGKRGEKTATKTAGVTNRKPTPTKKPNPKPVVTPAESILSTLKNSGISQKVAKASGDPALSQAFAGTGGSEGSSAGTGGSGLQGGGKAGGGTAVGVGGLGTEGFGNGATGTGAGAIPGKGEVAISTESVNVYVLGSITREQVKRVVDAHASEIRYCYEQELRRNPGLNGKLTMKWSIVDGGIVQDVGTKENTTGSVSLAGCISNYIKDWRFPAPAQGSKTDVDWPWTFKPRGT